MTGTLWALRQLTRPHTELRDRTDCSGGKWPMDTSGPRLVSSNSDLSFCSQVRIITHRVIEPVESAL